MFPLLHRLHCTISTVVHPVVQYPIQAECGGNFIGSVVYRRLLYEVIIPSRSNIVLELFNGIRSTWMVVGSAIRSIREYLKREFHLLRIIIISLLILRRERKENALSLRSGPIIHLHIGNELDQRPKHYHMSCRVRLTIHPISSKWSRLHPRLTTLNQARMHQSCCCPVSLSNGLYDTIVRNRVLSHRPHPQQRAESIPAIFFSVIFSSPNIMFAPCSPCSRPLACMTLPGSAPLSKVVPPLLGL
jgi:hypothetical protein